MKIMGIDQEKVKNRQTGKEKMEKAKERGEVDAKGGAAGQGQGTHLPG